MTRKQFTGGRVEYIGDILPIFSACPFKVVNNTAHDIRIDVTYSGTTYSLTRSPKSEAGAYVTSFDLSRVFQLLANYNPLEFATSDPSDELDGLYIVPSIKVYDDNTNTQLTTFGVTGIWAACNAHEGISAPSKVRVYMNYPFTLRMGVNEDLKAAITIGSTTYESTGEAIDDGAALQVDIKALLTDAGATSALATLNAGGSIDANITWCENVNASGSEFETTSEPVVLVGDNTPANKGVYLRWLSRNGSVCYWLFTQSKKTTAASVRSSYVAYEEQPNVLNGASYPNTARADFKLAETLTIGSGNINADEYELLNTLSCSPYVQMYLGANMWQAVNVVAASHTRKIPRSGLARVYDYELAITLPAKDTITL